MIGDKKVSGTVLSKIIWNSLVLWPNPLNSGGSLRDVNMRGLNSMMRSKTLAGS